MLWRSTESLMSIHVGIQTQNKFENSKNNLELAGQKNADLEIAETLKWKKYAKRESKTSFL